MAAYEHTITEIKNEEQERVRCLISIEIHDHIAQVLNLARMNMKSASQCISDTRATELIQNSNDLLDCVALDLENIGHSNNGTYIKKKGLLPIIKEELSYIEQACGITCECVVEGENVVMDANAELIVYRIAQEVIHNCLKHASATQITVSVCYDVAEFTMLISDNGAGFEGAVADKIQGSGLLNIFNQANLLNGELIIHSERNMGTTVKLKIPYY